MPRASVIAKNYSKALFIAARRAMKIDEVDNELSKFKDSFNTNFANELKNPVISKRDLEKVVDEIAIRFKLSSLTKNFLSSIIRNRRLNLFPEIYEEFSRILKKYKNIIEIEVISAKKTDKVSLDKIKSIIQKKYPDKTINIKEAVNDNILGGFQVKIGSNMADASLRNQLEKIKKECIAAIN